MSNQQTIDVFSDEATCHLAEIVENILIKYTTIEKAEVVLSINRDLDVEGCTYEDSGMVFIELNSPLPDLHLTLGHELVHIVQILNGTERSEKEAYEKEQQFAQEIKNSLAI